MTTVREALNLVTLGKELSREVFNRLHYNGLLHDDGSLTPISNRLLEGTVTEEDKRILFPWLYNYPEIMCPIVEYYGKYEAMRK